MIFFKKELRSILIMGWLQRLFGLEHPPEDQLSQSMNTVVEEAAQNNDEDIPLERIGLSGEYDQSGLAKRVAYAFDQYVDTADLHRLWVAQTGSTVVLKGEVPSQELLDRAVEIAYEVKGCKEVDTDQVTIEE